MWSTFTRRRPSVTTVSHENREAHEAHEEESPKKKLESRVGRLSDEDIVRANRAVVVFLGLAGPGAK